MMEMYKKSGQIVSRVREMATNHVKADMKIIDLSEYVENNIIEMGGIPAFPCNVSINEVTAHYTSPPGDDSTIKRGDLVKIDLGAHVDGYIADSAVSVIVGTEDHTDLDPSEEDLNWKMIDTAQSALENAISTIKDGIEMGKVGTAIEETINQNNLNSVSNLTGHSMDRWILHSGISVPNIKESNKHIIHEGDVLAIEPFVTNGIGRVEDMNDTYIFRFLRDRPMRMLQARKLLKIIKINYRTLPFSQRWLKKQVPSRQLNIAMKQLLKSQTIYPYHVLKEKSNARVAQAEHTVIVESDGCEIITK